MQHPAFIFQMVITYLNDALGDINNLQNVEELEDGLEVRCKNGDVVTIKVKKNEN